ncbi:hypothetical protein [Serratia ureilytica]|uniref:hypothetical protein n=1 Tax=Serratia ureilytica TaxID=300181 RepID=UPI0018D6BD34|nr:hypothetical protein [Serratia ureilytica]MBH3095108.1 hypothetical protein [Serratia ureilytica]MBN5217903.1 hypothetical protein [Serratia ureilytica]
MFDPIAGTTAPTKKYAHDVVRQHVIPALSARFMWRFYRRMILRRQGGALPHSSYLRRLIVSPCCLASVLPPTETSISHRRSERFHRDCHSGYNRPDDAIHREPAYTAKAGAGDVLIFLETMPHCNQIPGWSLVVNLGSLS